MAKKVYTSKEELDQDRRELADKFENGELPNYLHDYFDERELNRLHGEIARQRHINKYTYSTEERINYVKNREKEFWENNETEIIKVPRTIGKHLTPIYEEPLRNEKNVEEEYCLSEDERRALVHLCEDDLYLFAVRYFPHYLKRPSSVLHKYIYNTLSRELGSKSLSKKERKGLKYAIAAPRGNSKSTLVSNIFPIWCVCFSKKRFIIIVSNTAGQAEDFLTDIKIELENNAKLLEDFPHVCGRGSRWRTEEIITNNDIKIRALGTGSQIRGRRFGIYRPDLLIGDDLENQDQIRSESLRDFIRFTWFNKDVLFAGGEEGSEMDIFIVGTILGKDSLLNALLNPEEYPGWKCRRFKSVIKFSNSALWDDWTEIYKNRFDAERLDTALQFFEDHKEEMLEGTEILWPEGRSYYKLMENFVNDRSAFESEDQNSPIDITKILILKDELNWDDFRNREQIVKVLPKCHYFGALDPSLGKKSTSGDYSCITTLARDPASGYIFVVDFDIKRRSVDEQITAILKNHERYKYKSFAVETNAFQLVVADNLKKISRESGAYIHVIELQHYHDKKMRIEGMIPFIKDGTLVFDSYRYKTNRQYNLAIDQLLTFTGENDRHDDAPDSLEMAFTIAKKPKFRLITKSNL